MSDSNAEASATTSEKPVPKIKDISMMKAWKDSKVNVNLLFLLTKSFHIYRLINLYHK